MSEQENLDIVRRGYEAFGRGDLDGLVRLFDENIEWTSPGPEDLPTSGTRRGAAAVRDFFGSVGALFQFERFEPREFIAQGDRVIVLGEDRARLKATGNVIDGEWAHSFTLRNGKIVNFKEYLDTSAVVLQLRAASV